MVKKPLISIVIPVYNVESYLSQCLDSLVLQNINDFEVILVNDGSTDNSLSICEKYSSMLPNCKIIEQNNEGVSAARNKGIQHASGSYLYFMDSDDWLDVNFIETLTNEINSNDFEIFVFGYNKVNTSGKLINKVLPQKESIIYRNKNFENLFDCLNDGLGLAVWDKVIKASVINYHRISFQKMRNAEDFVFSFEVYSKANSIKILKNSPYNYRIQISGKRNDNYDLPKNHLIAMENLLALTANHNDESTNKFISKMAVLWLGIVNPINIASFEKLNFNQKIKLINITFDWSRLSDLMKRVNKSYFSTFERLAWKIFSLKNSYLVLIVGFFISKMRKLKYN